MVWIFLNRREWAPRGGIQLSSPLGMYHTVHTLWESKTRLGGTKGEGVHIPSPTVPAFRFRQALPASGGFIRLRRTCHTASIIQDFVTPSLTSAGPQAIIFVVKRRYLCSKRVLGIPANKSLPFDFAQERSLDRYSAALHSGRWAWTLYVIDNLNIRHSILQTFHRIDFL